MGEGGSDTAAVKIDDASAQTAGEDDAPIEGIVALRIEQAETLQEIARISLRGEMPTQVPAGGVTDAQFSDQGGIVQSALLQIAQRLRVASELPYDERMYDVLRTRAQVFEILTGGDPTADRDSDAPWTMSDDEGTAFDLSFVPLPQEMLNELRVDLSVYERKRGKSSLV
jgi:hypothetical protein